MIKLNKILYEIMKIFLGQTVLKQGQIVKKKPRRNKKKERKKARVIIKGEKERRTAG